ncbi:hypothetical protein [Candidatus Burkholderia verschuerenii]|uniref:hypothetical protein n=1 Tax=Candidatus Burkholderia verschuerenii TaxID=242163 RepID=UPI000A4706A8|nr:hypothetical protein [Candidatus Burkholderia verschuerenii]
MSHLSQFGNRFEAADRPTLEPEVKYAILASWAAEQIESEDQPTPRLGVGVERAAQIDGKFLMSQALDRGVAFRRRRGDT